MRWLVAPGSFKESVTAEEAAAAMCKGLRRVFPKDDFFVFPISDGGSGFLERIVSAQGGRRVEVSTTNAIGQPVVARLGIVQAHGEKLAIVESAEACGLAGVPQSRRDPTVATTFGLGAILDAAAANSPDRILVGCGDSATNDGGLGVATALGAQFLDSDDKPISLRPEALKSLQRIDCSLMHEWTKRIPITIACNLTSLLLGPEGTTRVYGEQKGLPAERIAGVEAGLERLSEVLFSISNLDLSRFPGGGASGGLAASLVGLIGAKIRYSMAVVSQFLDFDSAISSCDVVLTGEGLTDARTFSGKAPGYLALLARKYGKPVFCISGGQTSACENSFFNGIDAVHSATMAPMLKDDAIAQAQILIEHAALRLARTIAVARGLPL